jgi:hypothetical protein
LNVSEIHYLPRNLKILTGFVKQSGVMRRLMNFIISTGLIAAGLYVFYEELFVRYSGLHGRYEPLGVGLILVGSGVVWLWYYVIGDIVLKRLIGED